MITRAKVLIMSETFAQMFEESLKDTVMTIGEVIKAEVVSVDGDYVTVTAGLKSCLLYTSPSPRDQRGSRMPSSA